MEKENYMHALSRHCELPIGFSNYLEIALEEFRFDRDQILEQKQLTQLYLPYFSQGLAMLCTENLKTKAIMAIDFYGEGDFLPSLPVLVGETQQLKILFLEKTRLLALSEKHFTFLPKIFPSTSLLYQKIGTMPITQQLKKEVISRIKPAHRRQSAFEQWRPKLTGRIPENYLKGYLNLRLDK